MIFEVDQTIQKMGRGKVLIEPIPKIEKTRLGIYLPMGDPRKALELGTVVALGDEVYHPKGHKIPTEVQIGDVVLYDAYGKEQVLYKGKNTIIARYIDCYAVVDPECLGMDIFVK